MTFRINPKSTRAGMHLKQLEERFEAAAENLDRLGRVNMRQIGIDWNPSTLEPARNGKEIVYSLASYSDDHSDLVGRLRNVGRDQIGIEVVNRPLVGTNGFGNDEIVRNLSEAVGYAAKLDIKDGAVILPNGKSEGVRGVGEGITTPVDDDNTQYRLFAAALLEKAQKIIVGRVGNDFGEYIVAQMPSGFYVAYSTNYGDAPYIVTDFKALLKDKKQIRKDGDAIRFRRDRRGEWAQRILEEIE